MPQAVFLPGRMKRYQEVSRQIMNIFDSFSPLVEQLSVDEAFLDISGMELLAGSERDIGFKVKRSIKEKTGSLDAEQSCSYHTKAAALYKGRYSRSKKRHGNQKACLFYIKFQGTCDDKRRCNDRYENSQKML